MNPNDTTENSLGNYFLEDPSLMDKVNEKQNKKIILYDLPQIDDYRRLVKPVVSEEKKIMIKEKLDLQQESLLQCKEREKRNEYYLNYAQNPFIKLENNVARHYNKEKIEEASKNQIHDIIYELNALKEKEFQPQFLKMKENFNNMKRDTDLLSQKIIENASKKKDFELFNLKEPTVEETVKQVFEIGTELQAESESKMQQTQKPTNFAQQMEQNEARDILVNPILRELPDNPLSFDEIINIKEQNFFIKNTKKMNIFKFALNNEKDLIGKELLNKYYFSFTNMVEKLQKIKISIYRDISRMARRIMLGISTGKQDRFDYIDSYELSFKISNLTFQDIMSVASGRFTPEFVSKTTNFDVDQNLMKQKSQTSSQEDEEEIYYDKNSWNYSVRFYNKGEEEQQIKNYLKLQFNKNQVQYEKNCLRYKQNIRDQLNEKEKLIESTVQDRHLHSVLNHNIRNQLNYLVNLDKDDVDVDRLIRKNKSKKDKNTSIKLETVLETFKLKNQHENIIAQLGKQGKDLGLDAALEEEQESNENFLNKVLKRQIYEYHPPEEQQQNQARNTNNHNSGHFQSNNHTLKTNKNVNQSLNAHKKQNPSQGITAKPNKMAVKNSDRYLDSSKHQPRNFDKSPRPTVDRSITPTKFSNNYVRSSHKTPTKVRNFNPQSTSTNTVKKIWK